MPEALVEFFLRFLTDEKDLVMDPFAGSNTTGFVSERLNRRWIGIESNLSYIESSQSAIQKSRQESGVSTTISAKINWAPSPAESHTFKWHRKSQKISSFNPWKTRFARYNLNAYQTLKAARMTRRIATRMFSLFTRVWNV